MKPIFPVNLCKLTDRLFTEFESADFIVFHSNKDYYLTVVVQSLGCNLAVMHLRKQSLLTDVVDGVKYKACKELGKMSHFVDNEEAVSGLKLEKSMKKLRAIVHCCQKGSKVLLNIDDKLLETLKVLDSVF
jgi:hypothetical protein